MLARYFRLSLVFALMVMAAFTASKPAWAQEEHPGSASTMEAAAPHEGGEHHGAPPVFDKEQGTILHPFTAKIFHQEAPESESEKGGPPRFSNVKYDWVLLTGLVFIGLAAMLTAAARNSKIRPEGKAGSSANLVEAAVDGFRDYLISVMGEDLAKKYAALISAFFFTILVCNWLGLIPGLLAPTSIPAVPISMAIAAFFCVHFIAIKEAGFKSWIMHFVGEPIWLAPLNFPLHIIGEFIKPLSLSLRLLCNVFGEEQVVVQLTVLSISIFAALHLPLPLQLPMLLLGTFFGFLQALVFSTLLAIYIAILATHHDDHDEHNAHGHVEHDQVKGHHVIVGHPSQTTVA